MSHYALAFLNLSLVGCRRTAINGTVEIGMQKADVIQLLGKPTSAKAVTGRADCDERLDYLLPEELPEGVRGIVFFLNQGVVVRKAPIYRLSDSK